MECPNEQCFCDGSCFDNESFNSSWESYDELIEDVGLEYFEEYPTIGKSMKDKFPLDNVLKRDGYELHRPNIKPEYKYKK